jgi:two-component system, OmpR family, sensor histidine kinase CpxA
VRDYGPGVPEEALPHIFDAFYRVESDRGRLSGGVGLGLSIARRALELHKGAIRARNVEPGLEMEIEVPASGAVPGVEKAEPDPAGSPQSEA